MFAEADAHGAYRRLGDAIDPGGNWKRLRDLPDDAPVLMYHATSRENAEAILRDGYAAQRGWTDASPEHVYMGGRGSLGSYAGRHKDYVLVAFEVKKGDLEPDKGSDWKAALRNPQQRSYAKQYHDIKNPSAVDTFALINQVRARKDAARPVAIVDFNTGDILKSRGEGDRVDDMLPDSERKGGDRDDDAATRPASDRSPEAPEAEAYPLGRTDPRREANFRRWFGDSKVVDKDGKPRPGYHGTKAAFNAFDRSKQVDHPYGRGFYFSESPDVAAVHAGETGSVIRAYLSIPNPFDLDAKVDRATAGRLADAAGGLDWGRADKDRGSDRAKRRNADARAQFLSESVGGLASHALNRIGIANHQALLRAAGYDGITRIGDDADGKKHRVWIAFDPEQIKSATGNRGSYDPADPRMAYQRPEDEEREMGSRLRSGLEAEEEGYRQRQKMIAEEEAETGSRLRGGLEAEEAAWRERNPEEANWEPQNPELRAMRERWKAEDKPSFQRPTRTGAAFGQTAAGTTVVSAETKWKKLQRLIQDRFNRFATVQKDAVDATGRLLNPKADVYDAEIRFHGRTAERIRTYGQKYTDKLVDWMRSTKVSDTDLGDYMTLLHKPDRDAALAGVIPPGTMGPRGAASGWTAADAAARWAELEAKYGARVNGAIPALQPGRQIVRDMIRERERLLLHYGLADRATLRGWRQKYGPDYVPQRDFEGDDEVGQGVGRGYDVRGAEAIPAMGRSTHADNPVAWATHQLLRTVIRGEKERVARSAYRLAKQYPELGIQINKKHMKGGQRDMRAEADDFVVKVKGRGGKLKQVRLTFPDPLLHRALQGLDAEQSHVIVDALGKVTRAYTQLVTSWSPEFIFSNLSRDAQQAFATLGVEKGNDIAKKLPKYMPGAMKGMWQILRSPNATGGWATWAKEFREDGGAAGWYNLKPAEELAKDFAGKVSEGEVKRRLGKAVQMVEDANATIENGTRLAAYRALRESGVPRTQAATYVKGMTLNFNKRGELGQAFNSLYAFSNASVQGVKRLGEVLNSPKGRAVAASIMGLGLTMDMLNRSMTGDDDKDGTNDYDAIPDFVKERNLILPTGGKPLTIPLPYGFNVLYAAGANLSAVLSGAKTAGQGAGAVATALTSMMNPLGASPSWAQALSPTILDPIAQISENQDFAGNAVRPDRYPGDRRPDSQLFFKTVSPTAKWLANAFNTATGGDKVTSGLVDVSPETIELLSGFVTGGLGRFVRQTVEAGGMALTGELPSVRQTPFARRLFYDEHPGALSGRYREMVADLEQAEDQYEYALKGKDIERAKGLRKQVQLKKLYVNEIESQIKKLRKLGDMSPKLKDRADAKIRDLQASAMRRFERAQA